MELTEGADLRKPQFRREVFHRFYTFHLTYRSHPGCVYYLLPYLAEVEGWDEEQRAWAAWINGNTQNPVSTWLLMRYASRPSQAGRMLEKVSSAWDHFQWDTDRRHWKSKFDWATRNYLAMMKQAGGQLEYWQRCATWSDYWRAAVALPSMGRLSAWSYLEYVKLLGVAPVAAPDTLMLEDMNGSRSHRNGLCLVLGYDEFISDEALVPGSSALGMSAPVVRMLERGATGLLAEAQKRNPGRSDVDYSTLESTLCTYKSWHKPNRRYPGVYNDMLYNRIVWAEKIWGKEILRVFWDARLQSLPPFLRLEDNPGDPGLSAVKQNWYRENGGVPVMGHVWPEMWTDFDTGVQECRWGTYR